MSIRIFIVITALVSAGLARAQQPTLDYAFFKPKGDPIFLKKREAHPRCYVCHDQANNGLRLEALSPGATFWSDEQSRKNFATASALVVPGDLADSRLLLHPLAPEAGGDLFHSGGRQFASKDDPDWKILAQ